jgi:DNA-binding MarR family transcriptional regulator
VLPQALLAVSRDFEPRLLRELHARGHDGLRPAFGRLLYLVWDAPLPLVAVAEELGISRQAAGQLVDRIEAIGYVERRPNPGDGRSKLVCITALGRAVDDDRARDAIAACEAHYATIVGEPAVVRFAEDLTTLRDAFDVARHATPSVGVLPFVALHGRDAVLAALLAAGHAELTPTHLDVLAVVRHGGARPVDVARAQGVSRQAAGASLQELEQLGYLVRRPDPDDKRGVVFAPDDRGAVLLDDTDAAVAAFEDDAGRVLGARRLARLRHVAGRLAVALGPGRDELSTLATSLVDRLGPDDARRLAALLTDAVGGA